MTRYRRRELTAEEKAASTVAAVAVGIGVAAVGLYALRILLAREPLAGGDALPAGGPKAGRSIPARAGYDPPEREHDREE